ncbi:hypothetical protein [Roseivirga pacifica]|uniref:hypothetical protein n=1 Tax=Roseivirga pacifica TaxID=1267423 RepID=UPI00227D1C4B|nr:hypothetical protein [Roseivirga pacifica]
MKPIKLMVNAIALVSVLTFIVSLILVAASDGRNEVACFVCMYSVAASFLSLIFVDLKGVKTQFG